ncbi:MAG TPA: PPOX class F420-dependent oxidoreductase [Acidimicrobiales bacterium]|nr:PPOX class F420-dependent oxidoreductase [Acidimicrobiales bacterium]
MGRNERSRITLSDDEVTTYIDEHRTAVLASVGPGGTPHVVAMWYAVIDGVLWFETKAKSQKAQNLRRDQTLSVLLEDGETYDQLRGVSMEGRGVIVEDADALWEVGVSIWERYTGPYTEEVRPLVEFMLTKRVAIRFDVTRIRSWDHAKLGMDPIPIGGTTAAHLGERMP